MSQSVKFYNRYTQRIEVEKIFGENWLRFIYDRPLGKLPLHLFVKRKLFSRWYGAQMDQPSSRDKIEPFCQKYNIDKSEFDQLASPFRTFNEFFARPLNADARPIAEAPGAIVFPADGRHLLIPEIATSDSVYVKGQKFKLDSLLGSKELAKAYAKGSMLISRLCPVDYHRFHFCCAGLPSESQRIKGNLFSVNPIALRRNLAYLWHNERQISTLNNDQIGQVLTLELGATCVGKIQQTYTAGQVVSKGSQKGLFLFGGSCVITLFEPGRIRFADDLIQNSRQGTETYARMGDTVGCVC